MPESNSEYKGLELKKSYPESNFAKLRSYKELFQDLHGTMPYEQVWWHVLIVVLAILLLLGLTIWLGIYLNKKNDRMEEKKNQDIEWGYDVEKMDVNEDQYANHTINGITERVS